MPGRTHAGVSGIVLAGVHRWGESDFERLLPRPLVPVAESPLVGYALRWLRDAGICDTTICANSDSRLVRRCLGDGSSVGLDVRYYEDMTPRGPAGCVRDASLGGAAQDIVVADGSVIPSIDLPNLLDAHRRSGAAITVVVAAATDSGAALGGMPCPVGVFVFARRVLELVPATGYQDIKELLIPKLHERGEHVAIYRAEGACPRVTDVETYLVANEWAIDRIVSGKWSLPGYVRAGQICIHEDAKVAEGTRLVGPVLIGPDSRVADGAMILGPTTIGADCVVAERALVCRSVLWDRCRVGDAAMVDQCVLATGAEVAPEASLYNALQVGAANGRTAARGSRASTRRDGRKAVRKPAARADSPRGARPNTPTGSPRVVESPDVPSASTTAPMRSGVSHA